MTSLGTKEEIFRPGNGGVYSFRIKGALHHRIGPLVASQGAEPRFAQIYIHDPHDLDKQLERRMAIFHDNSLDAQLLQELTEMLYEYNPLIQSWRTAAEVLADVPDQPVALQLRMLDVASRDPRTYNRPTADEIGVLIVGLGEEEYDHRDIVLHHRDPRHGDRGLKHVTELSSLYLPLRYVLLLIYGEQCWRPGIPLKDNKEAGPADRDEWGVDRDPVQLAHNRAENPNTGKGGTRHVTQAMFHSYYLHDRPGIKSLLLRGGRLFQEWVVDAAAVIEQNRLKWISENQPKLRAEKYSSLRQVVAEHPEANADDIGHRVVLPSSFSGSPRQMRELYQDAMAVVRYYGKPDLFITMTCNPNWPEIKDNLFPGQITSDRPDLVSRVFNLKLQALLADICKKGVFGTVKAHMHVIEFQKRGLPHAHMLFILDNASTLHTADHVDSVVKAELPDPEKDPELWQTVTTCMLHGPCTKEYSNAGCLGDGRGVAGACSKRFPKEFQETTNLGSQGYPLYRRRNEGPEAFRFKKTLKRADGTSEQFEYTNEWVVPYNPYLSKKYNCHINVEVCSSIKAIKYLYKYVYKGPDRANVGLGSMDADAINEPKIYLDARYISPPEACARILGLKMHSLDPAVVRLDLHLEDDQTVYFDAESDEIPAPAVNLGSPRNTKLTAYFAANARYSAACDLLYVDFPTKYVYVLHKWLMKECY
jgi:hypothetical protein